MFGTYRAAIMASLLDALALVRISSLPARYVGPGGTFFGVGVSWFVDCSAVQLKEMRGLRCQNTGSGVCHADAFLLSDSRRWAGGQGSVD